MTGPTVHAARRVPWRILVGAARVSATIWLLLRLLLAAVFAPIATIPYVGGIKPTLLLLVLVPLLVLRDARRMNERVFCENVGVSERTVAAVAAVTVLVLEILLRLSLPLLAGAGG